MANIRNQIVHANGQIMSCSSIDDWIWMIRRISVLFRISHIISVNITMRQD